MDDLISRQGVLDWLEAEWDGMVWSLFDGIRTLPSVQPQSKREWYQKGYEAGQKSVQPQRWIPVSEALPQDDEDVIVTCLDDSGDTPFSYTAVAWHYEGMWVCDNERCPFVTAWMPLPEPWRGGQDET